MEAGLFVFCCYFTPAIIAICRKHHQIGAILVINVLLGWTFIGWIVALAMACSHARPATSQVQVIQVVQNGESVATQIHDGNPPRPRSLADMIRGNRIEPPSPAIPSNVSIRGNRIIRHDC